MEIIEDIKTVNNLEWLRVDKFLYEKFIKNIGAFEHLLALDVSLIEIKSAALSIARKGFLDEEAMAYIVASLNKGVKVGIDLDMVRRFLSENMSDIFCEIYIEEIREFTGRGSDTVDTYDFMRKTLNNLGGETAAHFITNGVGSFYNE